MTVDVLCGRRYWRPILFLALLGLSSVPLHAQQNDERRILEQRGQIQQRERERELLKDELDTAGERPTITVDGQTYTVHKNASDLGRALYLSLQHRQWDAAAHFLDEYLTLPDRDPMLVHYAQGLLARVQGHYDEAERELRALLALQPDFLLGRLELARTLFEDQQDIEAAELFAAIAASIDPHDPKTEGVRKSIATFRQALDNRQAFSGAVAFGPTWSDNVNRTSARHDCLLYVDEICLTDRQTPDAVVSSGVDYDASLSKRVPLVGHHGLYLQALLFGQSYRNNSLYNELNASVLAGYSLRSGRHNLVVGPTFDYYALANTALYGAWGLHGEWGYKLSGVSLLKLEGEWKDMRYRPYEYAINYNGTTRSLSGTYFRSLDAGLTVFGGLDLVDSDAPVPTNAYLQKGLRLGASLQWPRDWSSTLFVSVRQRKQDAYNALLEAQRKDNEQSCILMLKPRLWNVGGFTPLLTLRHSRVSSNVDWLYSYDKSAISLKLERAF